MAKRRPSGDGMVRKREDGRWEGRIVVGHKSNGDSIFRYIYADTQKELTAKLRQNIDAYQGVDLTEESRMTLSEWLDRWLEQMPAWDKRSSRNSPLRICGNCTVSFWNRGELPLAPAKAPASLPPPSAVSTPPSTKPSKRQQIRG